jgi:hypothetical protein
MCHVHEVVVDLRKAYLHSSVTHRLRFTNYLEVSYYNNISFHAEFQAPLCDHVYPCFDISARTWSREVEMTNAHNTVHTLYINLHPAGAADSFSNVHVHRWCMYRQVPPTLPALRPQLYSLPSACLSFSVPVSVSIASANETTSHARIRLPTVFADAWCPPALPS